MEGNLWRFLPIMRIQARISSIKRKARLSVGQAEQKSKRQLYLVVIRQKTSYLKEQISLQSPKESSGFPKFANLL